MFRSTPDKHDNLLDTFLHHVQSTPDKKAVVYKNVTLTYQELHARILQIAFLIRQNYSGFLDLTQNKPVLIGVKCRSKLEALCCEFAILTLGAAFVPFDFNDTAKRQEFMIAKSGISLMLTDDDHDAMNNAVAYCNVLSKTSNPDTFPINKYEIYTDVMPHDLAYVLFTSGSTAQNPKGEIGRAHV